eukprot:1159714-Pelagomonas_calceolata.AAC.9
MQVHTEPMLCSPAAPDLPCTCTQSPCCAPQQQLLILTWLGSGSKMGIVKASTCSPSRAIFLVSNHDWRAVHSEITAVRALTGTEVTEATKGRQGNPLLSIEWDILAITSTSKLQAAPQAQQKGNPPPRPSSIRPTSEW